MSKFRLGLNPLQKMNDEKAPRFLQYQSENNVPNVAQPSRPVMMNQKNFGNQASKLHNQLPDPNAVHLNRNNSAASNHSNERIIEHS
jgi:hypothetical protein